MLTWDETVAPESGMVVTFLTSVDAPAWIRYGVEGQGGMQDVKDQGGEGHSFVLRNLAPDTLYSYQVGSGDRLASARYEFRTARPKADLTKLSFAVYSDAQDNGETGSFGQTIDELVQQVGRGF